MKSIFLACTLIVVTTATASAQEAADTSTTGTYVGFNLGPDMVLKPSGGGTVFLFGPEFGTRWLAVPVLLGFKSGVKMIDVQPRFKYDIPLSFMPGLIVSPFAGVNANLAFIDILDQTLFSFELGVGVGARAYYFFTPNIGAFLEPLGLNFNFFRLVDGNSNSDLAITYRLLFGGAYRF